MLDFNRCGIGILTDQCLPDQTEVTISLELDDIVVQDAVAVVHTCRAVGTLFRCGFQFRPDSASQLDREDACTALAEIEARLATFGNETDNVDDVSTNSALS